MKVNSRTVCYSYLETGNIPAALAVFNIDAFPESANGYGGLTERVDDAAFTPQSGPLLIRGAYVLAPDGESFRTGPAVLIENGLIQVLDSTATVPPQATTIDGTGRYLIPGLADAHVHLFQSRNDLVLLEDNPLEDIAHTRKINTVIAAGRVFDRDLLDRMLAAVRAGNDASRTIDIAGWE